MSVEDRWHHKGTRKRTSDYGRGKRWRVRNKGARTMSFHKKSDAQAHDVKVNNDLLKGLVPFDPTAGRVLVSEAVPKWLKERYSDVQTRRTVASRFKNHILPTFGHLRVCDITLSRVMEWWADMCEKTKPNGERYATSTLELVYVHLGRSCGRRSRALPSSCPCTPSTGGTWRCPGVTGVSGTSGSKSGSTPCLPPCRSGNGPSGSCRRRAGIGRAKRSPSP